MQALHVAKTAQALNRRLTARGRYGHKLGRRVEDFSRLQAGQQYVMGGSIMKPGRTSDDEGGLPVLVIRYRTVIKIEALEGETVELSFRPFATRAGEKPDPISGSIPWAALQEAGLHELTAPYDG